MTFNFGASKTTAGFALPTSTAATTSSLNFGAASGDPIQSKPLFGVQPSATTTTSSFGFGTPRSTSTSSSFTLTAPGTTSTASLGFPASATTAPASTGGFTLGSTSFSLGSTTVTPSTTSLSLGLLSATKSITPVSAGLALSTTSLVPSTSSAVSVIPSNTALTFSQLENAINKWTLELEEQGKVFANQAKHLNAWDRLLIGNGEKILNVSHGVERVKQQQQKLDQDLDFVLAQQNELEECIAPLEKELQNVPVTDTERNHTYTLAENIDSQLKQMSEDLKEIIDHLNESNKAQELSDPVAQIGRILSAHMNSLQWIDRSTSQISSQLDEISKMHESNVKKVDSLTSYKYNL